MKIFRVENEFFLSKRFTPKHFVYPESYTEYAALRPIKFEPWHSHGSSLTFHFKGLRQRYPERVLVPFARRRDCDDVACFDGTDTSGDPRVFIIHDWASPGWENRGEFKNFLEWLEFAKKDSEEWKKFFNK